MKIDIESNPWHAVNHFREAGHLGPSDREAAETLWRRLRKAQKRAKRLEMVVDKANERERVLEKRISELETENEDLETENEQLQEAWTREFSRRGTEVASVEREKALLTAALMRVRDECKGRDVLLYEIARDALEGDDE